MEKLPVTATAVAHVCEHRPGSVGIVIATTGDPVVGAALSQLPESRHDAALERWWIPAHEEPLRALREAMDRVRGISATPEVRGRPERFEQPSLSVAAVAGLVHRCQVEVSGAAAGEVRLRVCRRCHPDLEGAVRGRGICVARPSDSWWLTIDGGGRVLSLVAERPQLLAGAHLHGAMKQATARARVVEEMEELSTAAAAAAGPSVVEGVAAPLRPFQGSVGRQLPPSTVKGLLAGSDAFERNNAREPGTRVADCARAPKVLTADDCSARLCSAGALRAQRRRPRRPRLSLPGRARGRHAGSLKVNDRIMPAADIYALAAVPLRVPRGGASGRACARVIAPLSDSTPTLATDHPVGQVLQPVLERGLAHDPASRYATASQLIDAAHSALEILPAELVDVPLGTRGTTTPPPTTIHA